jgi:hypothetical protein
MALRGRSESDRNSGHWWYKEFAPDERAQIEEAYKPLGSGTAEALVLSDSPFQLSALIGHLKKEELREFGYKLTERADSLIRDDAPILDLHFYWHQRGNFFYRWRELDSLALREAVESYERQIELAPKAVKAFDLDDLGAIPAHAGYRQLRIIEEKRGNLASARALCVQAKSQGWSDDWDKHIARIDKKISKQSK